MQKMELTQFDISLLNAVIVNMSKGCGLKDLRLISNLKSKIKKLIKQHPEKPKILPPKDSKSYTDEEQKEIDNLNKKWSEEAILFNETIISVDFEGFEFNHLKSCILNFKQFDSSAGLDEKVFVLAKKFKIGI